MQYPRTWRSFAALAAALGAGCAAPGPAAAPPFAAARPAELQSCSALAQSFRAEKTVIDSAALVAAGTLSVGGQPIAAHCLVSGRMNERTSAVDGQRYAIAFQMRLPQHWNGRFFHQGNGGLDGFVQPAVGLVGGAGATSNALAQGFAVLSSDAGHNVHQLPLYGRDPQARLDYGYAAVAALTPMAKALIAAAYGKPPDRSYFGGCSNGGRHTMVTAAREAGEYDGYLAGDPGFNLPEAALAQLYGAQQYARVATTGDLASAFTPAERSLVARAVLARCDGLDGAQDGIVADMQACRKAFDPARDLPQCSGARDGRCLSVAQIGVLARVFAGGTDARGRKLYAPFPFDAGIAGSNWADWKFVSSVTNRDPVAVAYVFQTPPAGPEAGADPRAFALGYDLAAGLDAINAHDALYTESAMQFMTPPGATHLDAMAARGAKMIVYHGGGDPVFSALDTAAWFDALDANHGGHAADFARVFFVPGMNHCGGGPATDQFDMLTPLVSWVEQGRAPASVIARARGPGSAVPNPEVPADWAPDRSRPLCPYPQVARYKGSGDTERAENFECK